MKTTIKKLAAVFLALVLLCAPILALSGCSSGDGGISADGNYYVEMSVKNFGKVVLVLYPDVAPVTVKNFVDLVNDKFYDGLSFHRIIANFMIQGGAPNKTSREVDEIYGEFLANGFNNTLKHERGVISMARTDEPDSATSQFFICNTDYPYLDGYYAAFGEVIEGIEVIDAITLYGIQYTYNGIIYQEELRPVIEYMKIIQR